MNSILRFMASLLYSVKMILGLFIFFTTLSIISVPILFYMLRWRLKSEKNANKNGKIKVGIFHPYCNAGGGGEKVLWVALQGMQNKYPNAEFYIYTGDCDAIPPEILKRASTILNVNLQPTVRFVYLNNRRWIEAPMYPFLTLLGQSLGSVYLGYEALTKLNPDIFLDTTGHAFTLPLFKYLGCCKVGCYVHYPTITSDMLQRVSNRVTTYNNRGFIARSPFFTTAKLIYYRLFSLLYYFAGNCSDATLVNSTFTQDNLNNLWNVPTRLVFPPCDVDHLKALERLNRPDEVRIVSIGQFRPEKDHALQLSALYELREILRDDEWSKVRLVLCGSCRNSEDRIRVKDLQDFSKHLSLEHNVEFKVNISYDELMRQLRKGFIGIHTMWAEHFGIGVVELMAAGLITVAHRSGGPLLDIIETSEGSRLGFLADNAKQYADTIRYIMHMTPEQLEAIRARAKASVDRFSCRQFRKEFVIGVDPLFKSL